MFKKIFILLVLCLSLIVFTGCEEEKKVPKKQDSDAIKFKEEYESLNGKVFEYGDIKVTTRSIEIDEENPFVYKSAEEIIELMDKEETFVVYFGFNSCPWCRSVIGVLNDVAKANNLKTIYYVDVKEIRDVLELDENNNAITKTKGSEGYYKLLEYFKDVLDDYTLTTEDGETIKTGEKRIYAPNVVAVVNGVPKKLVTGISEKQTDSNMELTKEIKEDSYGQFESVISLVVNRAACSLKKDSKC